MGKRNPNSTWFRVECDGVLVYSRTNDRLRRDLWPTALSAAIRLAAKIGIRKLSIDNDAPHGIPALGFAKVFDAGSIYELTKRTFGQEESLDVALCFADRFECAKDVLDCIELDLAKRVASDLRSGHVETTQSVSFAWQKHREAAESFESQWNSCDDDCGCTDELDHWENNTVSPSVNLSERCERLLTWLDALSIELMPA